MEENNINVPGSKAYLDEEIKQKVLEVLESGQYILGENCKKFEKEFSDFIGLKHGILTNSATSAIQLILMSLGVKSGDEVIVPSLTAFPTIEPIFHVGAKPIFVDIGDDYLINPELIEQKITDRTKVIMPVHLYGNAADMDKIMRLANEYSLFVIEDCAQAHGAEYKGKKVGSFGKAGCFSFYPSKNMTFCGDGGIVVTNDDEVSEKVKMLRDHGRKEKYTHDLVGFNMRCNEIQAAIGLVQLKYLPLFVEKRRKVARLYNQLLHNLPVKLPSEKDHIKHAYHLYVIQVENRDKIFDFLKEKGIGVGIHYPVPCHLQPAVIRIIGKTYLPKTEEICSKILSLPIFPEITKEQMSYVSSQLRSALEK